MISLIRNYTHTFRRFIVTSTLNFCGLVVALCAFFLFMTKLEEQQQYNRCFDDYERMYRVEISGNVFGLDSNRIANVIAPLGDVARKVNHVEDAITEPLTDSEIYFFRGGKFVTSIPCIDGYGRQLNFWREGIAPDTLSSDYPLYGGKRDGMIIPRSFAVRWFGSADVVGKDLTWEMDGKKFSFKVVSVYEDFPNNCCVRNAMYRYEEGWDSLSYGNYNYHVYVKVDDPANVHIVEKEMRRVLLNDMHSKGNYTDEEIEEIIPNSDSMRIVLAPLHETYFSGVDDVWDMGDGNMSIILFVSAILVLVITNVNTMNYALAQTPFRIRNINTRRVFGANRYSLMVGLVFEALLAALLAFVLSMVILYFANQVTVGNINPLNHKDVVCYTFLAAIVIGLFTGIYPAYYATSFPPAVAMKGLKDIPIRSRRLRNIRIAFQLLISFIAFECVVMFLIQAIFIQTLDYGYDKDHILFGWLNSMESVTKKDSIRAELMKIEEVENVSFSRFTLGTEDRYMKWSRNPRVGDTPIVFTVLPVDKEYVSTMGIDILNGRDFTEADSTGAFIVNEAAVKKYGWIELNKTLYKEEGEGMDYPVVGVCTSLRISSLRKDDDQLPMLLLYTEEEEVVQLYARNSNVINIRLKEGADIQKVRDKINHKYVEMFPVEPDLSLIMLSDSFGKVYHNEFIFFVHTCVFAAIYILLMLIGVSSTITFENEFHRKEVGIRRVFGASVWDITFIKSHIYFTQLIVCFLVSIPFVDAVSESVLKGFTKQSPYLWLAYPICFLLMSIVTLSLIFIQRFLYAKERISKNIKTYD